MDGPALLARVVVEQADRVVSEPGIVEDLPQHFLRGVSRPHDEQPLALFPVRVEKGEVRGVEEARRKRFLDVHPDQQAHAADEHEGEKGVHDEDASRKPLEVTDEQQRERDGPRADHRRLDDVDKIGDARVAPHAAVETEPREEEDLHGDDPGQGLHEHLHLLRGDVVLEADQVGEHVGDADQAGIGDEDGPEILVPDQVFHLGSPAFASRSSGRWAEAHGRQHAAEDRRPRHPGLGPQGRIGSLSGVRPVLISNPGDQ
ncbi:MAG: hypothetical protein A4E73_00683 [Syntrophaceae bacterium PtaU1.Bin231]|nr:MAG: hypothetical protein A4E73_00683 [Syntrophaceae bacterium PtaU1.Bin231]